MQSETSQPAVNFPSIDDFTESYPRYKTFVSEKRIARVLYSLVMSTDSFEAARLATHKGLPAAAGIADKCTDTISQENAVESRDYLHQYFGALVCVLMEANGFKKTGRKGKIPNTGFTSGELYRRTGS